VDVKILVSSEFRFAPFAVSPGSVGMAIDFVHFETDLVPVDGGGWKGSGRGMDAVGAGGAHGDLVVVCEFLGLIFIVEIGNV